MKRCFTSLTALLCSAAILLCSLPMQALADTGWIEYGRSGHATASGNADADRSPGRTGSARGRKTAGSPSGGADRLRPLHG